MGEGKQLRRQSKPLTIAVVTEASDHGVRTYSCPAVEVEASDGWLTLWRRSDHPIRIPVAWLYWLRFNVVEILR